MVVLRWEISEDGKHQWLFAGDSRVELAWLEKRKIQWSAIVWLPGCNPAKQFASLDNHVADIENRVSLWFRQCCAQDAPTKQREDA